MKNYTVEIAIFNENLQINTCNRVFVGSKALSSKKMESYFNCLLKDGATPINCYNDSFMFETDNGTEITLILSKV